MLSWLRRFLRRRARSLRLDDLSAALGVREAVKCVLYEKLGSRFVSRYLIRPRQSLHPLTIRCKTSDIDVFRQIFIDREYGCLDDLPDVRLVIDCGGNVGYASAYFLSQFPRCQVIAVEPDSGNFAMMQRNLARFRSRVRSVRAAVWSHSARLALSQERFRDGREWARQVRLCGPDEEADLEGVDIAALLAGSGHERISLLKVDVEGAEAVIFAENFQPWLDKVDAIAIELHDDSTFGKASDVFFAATHERGFEVTRSGELTICRRPGAR